MPALTEVHFQNYRSFLDAKCRLSPVTVVIGANNAGKSNFLRGVEVALSVCTKQAEQLWEEFLDDWHQCDDPENMTAPQRIILMGDGHESVLEAAGHHTPPAMTGWRLLNDSNYEGHVVRARNGLQFLNMKCYELDYRVIGGSEADTERPFVHPDGEGVTRTLQAMALKQKKQFQKLEEALRSYVPEVEELLFEREDQGKFFLAVHERSRRDPVPLGKLSAGTRTILALLTILYQPNRPELILIEDIEHAIHPHGLKPLVETMRKISADYGGQIIFTTQSPYVLDAFQDPQYWDDVVIVEKRDGVSTLTNAKERLVALGYEREMDKVPLGDLWYSRLLGGVAGPNELWDEEEPKPDAK